MFQKLQITTARGRQYTVLTKQKVVKIVYLPEEASGR